MNEVDTMIIHGNFVGENDKLFMVRKLKKRHMNMICSEDSLRKA